MQCMALVMVGESTRPLIGQRGVGSEQQVTIYGKRSSMRSGTGVCVSVNHHRPTTAGDSERKPMKQACLHTLEVC